VHGWEALGEGPLSRLAVALVGAAVLVFACEVLMHRDGVLYPLQHNLKLVKMAPPACMGLNEGGFRLCVASSVKKRVSRPEESHWVPSSLV